MIGRPGSSLRPQGGDVRADCLIPHAQRQEDVAGHVLRVRGARGDLRIRPRGREPQRGVRRIVERVDDVVRRARVIGIPPQHLLGERAGAHVRRNVARPLAQPQERERVERAGLEIARVGRRQTAHGRGVERVAPGLGSRRRTGSPLPPCMPALEAYGPGPFALRTSGPGGRGSRAPSRPPAGSRPGASASSLRPSRPWRSRARAPGPPGTPRRHRRTRSYAAAGRHG